MLPTVLAAIATIQIVSFQDLPAPADPQSPTVEIVEWNGAAALELTGLAPQLLRELAVHLDRGGQWSEVLPVFVVPDDPVSAPRAMLGRYERTGDTIRFVPRFPLLPGLPYAIGIRLDAAFRRVYFSIPKGEAADPARVEAVYPSAASLPMNLLKFYIHFSAPMERGNRYRYVRLERSDGTRVEAPFAEIAVELWDADQRRFTVLLDPGRIKRGILPNEQMGLPLVEGGSYRLVIDGRWRDAQGNPLGKNYEKAFRATQADYRSPELAEWIIDAPAPGSKEAASIVFDEALDHALLGRVVTFEDERARRIEGEIAIAEDERSLQFFPAAPWQVGRYRVRIDATLEDLAGNSLAKPFEVDRASEDVESRKSEPILFIPFQVR